MKGWLDKGQFMGFYPVLKPGKLLEGCFSKGVKMDVFEFGEDCYGEYYINRLKWYE